MDFEDADTAAPFFRGAHFGRDVRGGAGSSSGKMGAWDVVVEDIIQLCGYTVLAIAASCLMCFYALAVISLRWFERGSGIW